MSDREEREARLTERERALESEKGRLTALAVDLGKQRSTLSVSPLNSFSLHLA